MSSSDPATPTRPSGSADEANSDAPAPVSPATPDRDGRSLEERTVSMDYDATYHYKDSNVGKHYHNKKRSSPNTSQSNLAALKDRMHVPDHAPHLVPTAADHRSRYLPGILYVPMLVVRWVLHPFRLLMGTAEDSDREVQHVHHHHHHVHDERGDIGSSH